MWTSQHASRRDMLLSAGLGFGGLALAHLLPDSLAAAAPAPSPQSLAPSKPHHRPRAKSVIFLFMEGGPSHLDSFDPKPDLEKFAGKPLPPTFKPVVLAMGENDAPIMPSKRKWQQHGQGGLWISDWLPHTAQCADDLCVIRSCWTNGLNHSGGVCQMNTGTPIAGRPSLGAWVSYGLGTENENLPAFVVMEDNPGSVVNGPRNWSAGFMPAQHQGTALLPGDEPIKNLALPQGTTTDEQRRKLDLLARINQRHAAERDGQSELEARIASYELAFRMQAEAPQAVDLSDESAHTLALYGIDRKETQVYGRMCLLARRLVERGVRFIQLYSGAGSKWDAHSGLEKNHADRFLETDQPIAGLLHDLKQRGLLNETLVIWGGEFGRTPMSEKGDGRDHNPYGFTMWVAGAGIQGGRTVGATDEIGLHAVDDRLHVHDLHATFLHLLGVDHMKMVYLNKGRPERATINEGHASDKVLGG